ncbi:site-specific integrase [Rhodovastum sp. RN2-1]|uniref:Site-specific integrase n=1 Tax=Limobrevibacterium gyesilva TaxID=2991712 RepID=A0AA41YQA5_9PROT|nr:site-specific integrase [Limobrevibacterium gyesilva]
MNITEKAISRAVQDASLSRKRQELSDAGCQGLSLRVTPRGVKSWTLNMRDRHGRMRRFPLGNHPQMGVAQARDAARVTRHQVRHEGADPVEERRRDRAIGRDARDGIGTLEWLLDTYEKQAGHKLRSWAGGRKRIELVFKSLRAKPLETLTVATLQIEADAYRSPGNASFAIRSLRPVLRWASQPARPYVSPDLCRIVERVKVSRRDRVLSREELQPLLTLLLAEQGTNPYAAAARFILLTMCRRDEAGGLTWAEIDMQTRRWMIPAARSKNKIGNIVPLSDPVHDLLAGIWSRMKPKPADLIFPSKAGSPLANWDRHGKRLQRLSKTENWHRHDLRRTSATLLGDAGVAPHIIEASLGHVIHSRLAGIYNKSQYWPEQVKAFQLLAELLDGIASGGAKVLPLRPDLAVAAQSA